MRSTALALLRCPRCLATGLRLAGALDPETLEVREGNLECHCGGRFAVRGGIADLTLPSPGLERARAHAFADACAATGLIPDEAALLDFEARHRRMPPSEAFRFSYGIILNFDRALELMAHAPDMAVLDVGAGSTWSTARLARAGVRAVACDLVRERWAGLESADALLAHGPHYERVVAEMDSLPFADGSFDRVLFHAAIHHSAHLSTALLEAARVLRPGGSVWLVNEPTASSSGWFDGRFSDAMRDTGEHLYRLRDYEEALNAAGLSVRIHYSPGAGARLDALAGLPTFPAATSPGQAMKYALVRAALIPWRHLPGFRHLFERRLYFLGLRLFGQFLIAEGTKTTAPGDGKRST